MGTAMTTRKNTYQIRERALKASKNKDVNITEKDTSETLNAILHERITAIKDAL